MVQTQKRIKECHTSFDIGKALIQTKFFSKKKLSPSARLVLWCLVVHWNHRTGKAFPRQITIAEETGLTKMSVIKAIEELRNAKIILTVKYKGRLNYQLTNVLLSYLNEPEDSIVEAKNDILEGKKQNISDSKQILPYIETNNFQQKKEKRVFQNFKSKAETQALIKQYEHERQNAVSPFDNRDCAIDVLKRILRPETQQHAFAKKMFQSIQAVWNFDETALEKIKKGEQPDGKCGTINS